MPPRPVFILIVAALVGLGGVAWSEREVFVRFAQRAAAFDERANARNDLDIWPPAEGGVVWRLSEDSAGPAIEADVDIPPFALRLAFAIRKNLDATLPASHIIEIVARVPPEFAGRAVAEIRAPEFKRVPRTPPERRLIGTMASVGDGTFLFGLSAAPGDLATNLDIMQANFVELPLTYASGKQATLTFEKGSTGTPVFARALAAWRRD